MPEKRKKSPREQRVDALKASWPRQRKLKPGQRRDPGPHGKTRELAIFDILHPGTASIYNPHKFIKAKDAENPFDGHIQGPKRSGRDRSLRGKQRRNARKLRNRSLADGAW